MKKTIATLCTALFAAVACADTWTDPETGIEWNYTVSDRGACVVSGSYDGARAVPLSTTGAIPIPSTLCGCPVTSIGGCAFLGCSGLTSVTMPNSVTSIGACAFCGCSGLTSVTIPSSVTSIGESAFDECSGLTSVTIPSSVTSIGAEAFSGCSGLTSVTIPEGVMSIGVSAFYGCSGLTSVTILSSVTSIGGSAFYGCSGLTSVTIQDGVTSIGYHAFKNCSGLTSVTIPNSVTSIGDGAFYGCSWLASIDFEGVPPSGLSSASIKTDAAIRYNVEYEDQWLPVIQECGFTNATPYAPIEPKPDGGPYTEIVDGIEWTFMVSGGEASVGSGSWEGARAVPTSTTGAITIPSTLGGYPVMSIGEYAFWWCSGLTSVTIPSSVTSIGYEAFEYCSGLTSVTIPSSVTSIGDFAFSGCSGLTSVTILSSVTNIACAFENCSGLTRFVVYEENANYKSVNGLLLTKDGKTLIAGVNGDVTIPEGVMSIGSLAFWGRSGLKSVTILSSVTSIGHGAFGCCSGLTRFVVDEENANYKSVNGLLLTKDGKTLIVGVNGDVVIPSSVTSIGDEAFEGCSGLTSVVISSSVTSIGYCAFEGCTGLTSVTIPSSVTRIGEWAFWDCDGLTSVTIPSSVTRIGEWAFHGCSGLTSVTVPGWKCEIDFSNVTSVTIPSSVTSIGESAFAGCSGMTSVPIPSSVMSIGYWAFENCSGLTSVTIPSSVTSIGNYAFRDCSGLTSVTIPSSVTSIGRHAFYGCSGLKTVFVDAGDKERVKKMIEDSDSGLSGVEYVVVGEYLVKFVAGDGAGTMADMDCAPGKVYQLTKNAFTCDGKRFAGWRGSNGKRYDDEMLVFDLGKAGEVLTLTAIWE